MKRKLEEMAPRSKGDSGDQAAPTNMAKAMRLGTDLFSGVGVGGVIGYLIDRAADTSPIFLIVFFFIGFAAGVRNIIRNAGNL